ncbi:UNVERIFIED_CONTAM: hypothetical protein K2H54_037628 [Gekko kuhli]
MGKRSRIVGNPEVSPPHKKKYAINWTESLDRWLISTHYDKILAQDTNNQAEPSLSGTRSFLQAGNDALDPPFVSTQCPCLGVDKSIQTDPSLLFGVDLKGDSGRVGGALFAKQCLLVGETLQFLISLVRRVESKIAELGEQIKLPGHDTNNSSHERSRINSVHGLSVEEPSIRKSNCKFSTILQQHQATLIIHPWRGQLMDWRSKRSAERFLSQILDIPHKKVDLESENHMKVTLTFASKYIPQLLFNNSARLKFFKIRSQRVFQQVAARSFQDLSMKSQMKESVQGKRKETPEVGKAGSSLLKTRNAEDSKTAEKPSSLGQEAILQNIKYMHDVLTLVQVLDERLNICNQGIHPQGHGPANLSSIAKEEIEKHWSELEGTVEKLQRIYPASVMLVGGDLNARIGDSDAQLLSLSRGFQRTSGGRREVVQIIVSMPNASRSRRPFEPNYGVIGLPEDLRT